jgi:hypothetical protein
MGSSISRKKKKKNLKTCLHTRHTLRNNFLLCLRIKTVKKKPEFISCEICDKELLELILTDF